MAKRRIHLPLSDPNHRGLEEVTKVLGIGPAQCKVILASWVNEAIKEAGGPKAIFREYVAKRLGEK